MIVFTPYPILIVKAPIFRRSIAGCLCRPMALASLAPFRWFHFVHDLWSQDVET